MAMTGLPQVTLQVPAWPLLVAVLTMVNRCCFRCVDGERQWSLGLQITSSTNSQGEYSAALGAGIQW